MKHKGSITMYWIFKANHGYCKRFCPLVIISMFCCHFQLNPKETLLSSSPPPPTKKTTMESTKVDPPYLETILFKFQPFPLEIEHNTTLQGTNISHLGKRNSIFKSALGSDMLVPSRVKLLVCRMDLLSNVAIFRINLN